MDSIKEFISNKIFKAGVTPELKSWERKRVQFLNGFSFFLLIFIPLNGIGLLMAGHTQLGGFFVGYAFIAAATIAANAFQKYNVSRFLIIVSTLAYMVLANYFAQPYFVESQIHIGPSYLMKHLLSGIFTALFIVYDLKHERKTLIALAVGNLLLMAGGFDFIMAKLGMPMGNGQPHALDTAMFIINILSISGQIIFLASVNQIFEQKLMEQKAAVENMNHEISVQNEELHQQQEELTTQKEYIVLKNKQLSESNQLVRSSIMAAEMIQQAVLPSLDTLKGYFADYLLFYKPKDIVSGDFYWLSQRGEQLWVVAADCTGHGVPGAFMTLLAHNMLDKIINIHQASSPADALERLDAEVRLVLHQQSTEVRSGMDLSIACFERSQDGQVQVQFSGAKSYLYMVENGALQEFRGDKISIGGIRRDLSVTFTNHSLHLPKGSMMYMASDGYQDQNNVQRQSFGRGQFKALLLSMAHLPVKEQEALLSTTLQAYMKDTEQRDDILVLGIRI